MSDPTGPVIVAFTGTREGLTQAQLSAAQRVISAQPVPGVFRHGGAKGADTEIHRHAMATGWNVHVHPGRPSRGQQFALDGVTIHPATQPLVRNKAMVDGADILIACPATPAPSRYRIDGPARGGTWSTVDHALLSEVTTLIVFADGDVLQPKGGKRYGL